MAEVLYCACVQCGHKEEKKNSEVSPKWGPECSKCHGPMLLEKISYDETKKL